ncbi:MAG: protoporphyrinogen oxidase [Candidatus Omnitrophota bacterium]
MAKICIIGGGISGLAVLHYLKQKYASRADIDIQLLEKNDTLGGTIKSIRHDDVLFETGPNGFLSSKPRTLEFIKELGLSDELVSADKQSEERFLLSKGKLHALPKNPATFLKFKLLSSLEKLRIPLEYFIAKGADPVESVYDFGKRRLGKRFAQVFLDPMCAGIFGGEAQNLNLKLAFPRIYEIEQTYGSLIKGMIALKKKKSEKHYNVEPKGTLTSFRRGMSQLIEVLSARYQNSIVTGCEIDFINKVGGSFVIRAKNQNLLADEVYMSVPAAAAAKMANSLSPSLAGSLRCVFYAPMTVAGLVYRRSDFEILPFGFGYLTSSLERRDILGVLFDSNIFPNRAGSEYFSCRVMMGGARNPSMISESKEKLLNLAKEEIKNILKVRQEPVKEFFASFPSAIPQYDKAYVQVRENIINESLKISRLHLAANYLGGISLNDCVENAYQTVQQSKF